MGRRRGANRKQCDNRNSAVALSNHFEEPTNLRIFGRACTHANQSFLCNQLWTGRYTTVRTSVGASRTCRILLMWTESLNISNIVQLKEGGNCCVEFLKQSATFLSSGASSRSVLTSVLFLFVLSFRSLGRLICTLLSLIEQYTLVNGGSFEATIGEIISAQQFFVKLSLSFYLQGGREGSK